MAYSGTLLRSVHDYQKLAEQLLPAPNMHYYAFPGSSSQTYKDSIASFSRYRFRPQVLADVSTRSLSTTVLGETISFPVGASPTALHTLAHKDGEIATAKGFCVAAANTILVQSSFSNKLVSEVAASAPKGLRWIQAYLFKDRRITEHLIKEAERAGYKAIVFTIDSPVPGPNYRLEDDYSFFTEDQQ
ncbi:uncharacterized protein, partial [Diadema antillarum]|uniref:uncharacterized protein n=1 Tax=Diadema antillarum TaxID=105358 RepID=UPI003A86EE1A